MKKILILGAGGSAAQNFINSLRIVDEDFYLVGTDINKYHLELAEGLDKKYIISVVGDKQHIRDINKIIKKEKIDFLHCQPDVEVLFVSENRTKINTHILLPSEQTIQTCYDKLELNKKLAQDKINVPRTFQVKNKEDLQEALYRLGKHEKAWLRAKRGAGSRASLPIRDVEIGDKWIAYWVQERGLRYEDFMVSEFLSGKEFAFQSIWLDGKLITSQARERMEYVFGNLTASGQSSSPSIAKTVHRNDVNETAFDAVRSVDPRATGIFCVDLKENEEGVPCITEINAGRFFTTSYFFSYAGANMPYWYVKMGLGEQLPKLFPFNILPENLYWIRLIDMGYKLVKGEQWSSKKI